MTTDSAFEGGRPEEGAPRGEIAFRRLRDAIDAGVFRPGDRMRETEVAEWLGMSRTPVREALQRLEARGLLEHAPHRGMIVAALDHQMIAELYATRAILEGAAARLAARHAAEAEIDALEDLVEQGERLPADASTLARHNRRFHEALYRAAHNRYLLAALDALRDSMALLGPTTLAQPGRRESAFEEHATLVAALRARAPDRAEAAALAHITAAHRQRLRQYFDGRDTPGPGDNTEA